MIFINERLGEYKRLTIWINEFIVLYNIYFNNELFGDNYIIRIAIGMKEFNMMIPVGVYSNGDVIDLHIDDLTDKEKKEFKEMVKDFKPINNKVYQ